MNIKRYAFLSLLILGSGGTGASYAQNKEVNMSERYGILTVTPLEKYTGGAVTLKNNNVRSLVNVTYGDAFGGALQKTQVGVTPSRKDLSECYEYDLLARLSRQTLPVPTTEKGAAISFYNLGTAARNFYGETNVYSQSVYETSHRDLLLMQSGAGDRWNGRATNYGHDCNRNEWAENRCKHYYVNGDALQEYSSPYADGSLRVVRTEDEDAKVQLQFTDSRGQTVLTRTIDNGQYQDTYYVYDSFGNLRFVLPPLYQDNPNLALYAYQYRYDTFDRQVYRKLPGAEPVLMVYDKANRLVFSQDGNQRAGGKWGFFLYDDSGRLAVGGECTNTNTTQAAGTTVKAILANSNSGLAGSGYTSSFALTDPQVYSVNYYDTYTFLGRSTFAGFDSPANVNYANGYPTGTMSRITGTDNYICSVNHYDQKGRIIKSISGNVKSGKETHETTYTFSGLPLTTVHTHTTGATTLTEKYTYSYDHADRLTNVIHTLNNGASVVLAANEYDELCRLKKKSMHNGTLTNQYTYNIRNWTTNIQGSTFSQTLHYTDGKGTPCYNGNISSMSWKTGNESTERGYTYTYDGLNRLTTSAYGEGVNLSSNPNRFNEQVTGYDKQGNILGIKRSGKTTSGSYDLIDNLTMTYNGNQLTKVTDNAVNSAYPDEFEFKDGANQSTEYLYDANGNLIKDLNKKISNIQYNYLNLPTRIQFEDGSTIDNLYGADGTKLRTTRHIGGTTTVTDYCGNVIYENGSPKTILTESGFISLNDNKYHYYLQDHQGNNRVVADQNGTIEEVNHYYPFGGIFESTSSIQPYKYNGKELDRSKGLDWYDYGARQYDAAIGRWHVVDPKGDKYYNWSPYAYCLNNPIKFIDPDGKDIVIYYGQSRPFIFNGYNQSKAPNNPFVQSFIQAYNYNIKNGGGDNLRNAAMERGKNFKIVYNKGRSFVDYDEGDTRRPFLLWDNLLGLETEEGYNISPATVLEHEMDHLYKEIMTSDKDYGEYRKTTEKGSDLQYYKIEERRVITGSEAKTARANKEYPKNYMRKSHGGKTFKVRNSTSNTNNKEKDEDEDDE